MANSLETRDGGLRRSVFKTRSTLSRREVSHADSPFRTTPRQRINSLFAPRQLETFVSHDRATNSSESQGQAVHDRRRSVSEDQTRNLQLPAVQRASEAVSITAVTDLGPRIRQQRKALGFSQQQLADLAGVGRRFVSELEAGKSTLEFDRVVLCCRALGLDVLVKARV